MYLLFEGRTLRTPVRIDVYVKTHLQRWDLTMRDRRLSVFALSEAHVRDPLRFHLLLRGAFSSSPSTAAAGVAALSIAAIPVSLCRSIPPWPLPGWEQQGRSEIVHAAAKEVDVVYAVQMYRLSCGK